MSFFSTSIQHCVLLYAHYIPWRSQPIQSGEKRYKVSNWKRSSKAGSHLKQDYPGRKADGIYRKLLDSQRSLSKVAEYKLNTQKSVGFYTLATIIINWSLKTIYHSINTFTALKKYFNIITISKSNKPSNKQY